MKVIIDQQDFIKIEKLLLYKGHCQEWSDKLQTGRKLFAKDIIDKGLLYKGPLKFNNKKTNNLILKQARDRHTLKKYTDGK